MFMSCIGIVRRHLMKSDYNICEHCNLPHPVNEGECTECGQPLVFEVKGKIAIWRLGDIEDGLLGPMTVAIRSAFGCEVIIQPGFVDERPSLRPDWAGRSATVLLNQMLGRQSKGVLASLCVTEDNITYNKNYNFLFGLAFMGIGVATMGLEPLRADDPDRTTLITRMSSIAIHELGHAFGLDDMPYDHADCVMCGEEENDSNDTIDDGTIRFCKSCRAQLPAALRRKT